MGTATGHLRVKDKKDTLLLDFKSTKATLHIITDTTEMYDNSTKRYTTKTSNGTNAVTYETYALANILTLQLSGSVYHIGIIDGAADMPVAGLAFNYYSEKNTESLTLYATTSLELSNAREIMRLKKIKYVDAKKLAKTVQLLPGSTLIFTVTK